MFKLHTFFSLILWDFFSIHFHGFCMCPILYGFNAHLFSLCGFFVHKRQKLLLEVDGLSAIEDFFHEKYNSMVQLAFRNKGKWRVFYASFRALYMGRPLAKGKKFFNILGHICEPLGRFLLLCIFFRNTMENNSLRLSCLLLCSIFRVHFFCILAIRCSYYLQHLETKLQIHVVHKLGEIEESITCNIENFSAVF